ncbi:Indoleamine 2,3-dioxygenase [Exidia glandulosa HHB12029]|uniref:Indoleamine 2,3-dioxygenase n=1 Tax=Exidia glandulosa HHB12029 TaxID=1314781 RepID=A0A165NHF3_EXIGL|nr:Indoleamine 2,3-dioxygenase [Exidia glandulosa HHB12029]
MDVLPIDPLVHSETLLRRAHAVLAFLLAFYAHSHPRDASAPLVVPKSIALPLSTVSRAIGIAPVVTYADTVLWNWRPAGDPTAPLASATPNLNPLSQFAAPSINPLSQSTGPAVTSFEAKLPELECLMLFTGLPSEAHFYLTSARIELASAAALQLMQRTLDELFLSDAIALKRIAVNLTSLAKVIDRMTVLLEDMKNGCDPADFYNHIRPWFRGGEAWNNGGGDAQGFEFEGVEDPVEKERARMTAGASAGQSSIVHALDIFLGTPNTLSPFLSKMEYYMPRHHRAFLRHLRAMPAQTTLSALVRAPGTNDTVKMAFNESVLALKRFRDMHIRIATLYIVNQARRPHPSPAEGDGQVDKVKGTGGTELVPFLKGIRDNTARTVVPL